MVILNNLAALHDGGVERSVYNYTKQLKKNDPSLQIDFVIHSERHGMLEDELTAMGCRVFHVAAKTKDLHAYNRDMKRILAEGHYDVFHCHQGYNSFYALRLAKKAGIPVRIAHSHTYGEGFTGLKKLKKEISGKLTLRYATELCATSELAGTYMWNDRSFKLFPPVMDTKTFLFDKEKRAKIRSGLNVDERPVVGCVARLTASKNLITLIDIFAELKKLRRDAVLVITGDGPMRTDIERHIAELGVSDVILTGAQSDVAGYYSSFDMFVLPTLFEGLGMVFVEAELNGLRCLAPEGAVPLEAKICENMIYVPKNSGPADWAAVIAKDLAIRDDDWAQSYDESMKDSLLKGAERFDTDKKGGELRKLYG